MSDDTHIRFDKTTEELAVELDRELTELRAALFDEAKKDGLQAIRFVKVQEFQARLRGLMAPDRSEVSFTPPVFVFKDVEDPNQLR